MKYWIMEFLLIMLCLVVHGSASGKTMLHVIEDTEDSPREDFTLKILDKASSEAFLTYSHMKLDCAEMKQFYEKKDGHVYFLLTGKSKMCYHKNGEGADVLAMEVAHNGYQNEHGVIVTNWDQDVIINESLKRLRIFQADHVVYLQVPDTVEREKRGGLTALRSYPTWGLLIMGIAMIILCLLVGFLYHKYNTAKKQKLEVERRLKNMETRHKENAVKAKPVGPKTDGTASKGDSTKSKTSSKGDKKTTPSKSSETTKQDLQKKCGVADSKTDSGEEHTKRVNASAEPLAPYRSLTQRIQTPLTSDEFLFSLGRIGDFIGQYVMNPEQYEVTSNFSPGLLLSQIPTRAPDNPEEFALIMNDLKGTVMNALSHWQHPRFHGFPTNGRSFSDVLTEAILAAIGAAEQDDISSRREVEMAVVNWYGRALGLPEHFLFQGTVMNSPGGGAVVDTSTDALLCAMVAAKNWRLEQIVSSSLSNSVKYDEVEVNNKIVVYGTNVHPTFERVAKVTGMKSRTIVTKIAEDFAIDGKLLEDSIQKDLSDGLIPTFVVCTLGSPISYSSDHLKTMAEVCRKYNLWLHVDASTIGVTWVDPKYRSIMSGLDDAMSLCVNSPRCYLNNSSPSFYWTQDQKQHKAAFTSTGFLRDSWTLRRSNKALGIKIWFQMRLYGINGLRNHINHLIDLTVYMESIILKNPKLRKFGKNRPTVCCLQYCEPGMSEEAINDYTRKLALFINSTHKLFVGCSSLSGVSFLCLFVSHERATVAEVDASVRMFNEMVEVFAKKKNEPLNARVHCDTVITEGTSNTQSQIAHRRSVTKDALPAIILRNVYTVEALRELVSNNHPLARHPVILSKITTPQTTPLLRPPPLLNNSTLSSSAVSLPGIVVTAPSTPTITTVSSPVPSVVRPPPGVPPLQDPLSATTSQSGIVPMNNTQSATSSVSSVGKAFSLEKVPTAKSLSREKVAPVGTVAGPAVKSGPKMSAEKTKSSGSTEKTPQQRKTSSEDISGTSPSVILPIPTVPIEPKSPQMVTPPPHTPPRTNGTAEKVKDTKGNPSTKSGSSESTTKVVPAPPLPPRSPGGQIATVPSGSAEKVNQKKGSSESPSNLAAPLRSHPSTLPPVGSPVVQPHKENTQGQK